jgi:hypothetical protein
VSKEKIINKKSNVKPVDNKRLSNDIYGTINKSQVRKSFLEPLGANDNIMAEKVIEEEFINGPKPGPNGAPQRTPDEIQMLETIKQRMKKHYNWTEETNVDLLAAQKCSDMIVEICEFFKCFHALIYISLHFEYDFYQYYGDQCSILL